MQSIYTHCSKNMNKTNSAIVMFLIIGVILGGCSESPSNRGAVIVNTSTLNEDDVVRGQAVILSPGKIYITIMDPYMIVQDSPSQITQQEFPPELRKSIFEKCKMKSNKYYSVIDNDTFNISSMSENDILVKVYCVANYFQAGVIHGNISTITQGIYRSGSSRILVNLCKASSQFEAKKDDVIVSDIFNHLNNKVLTVIK